MSADPGTFPTAFAIARGLLRWRDLEGEQYLEVGKTISEEMARNGISLVKIADANWRLTLPHGTYGGRLTPLVMRAVSHLMGELHPRGAGGFLIRSGAS
jgi:hypothetical protein